MNHKENCERKIPYSSKLAADNAILLARLNTFTPALYSYQCPHCRQWHKTKTRQITAEDFPIV